MKTTIGKVKPGDALRNRGTIETIAPVKGGAFEISVRSAVGVEYLVLHGDTPVRVQRDHVMRVTETIAMIVDDAALQFKTIKRSIGPRIPRRGKPIRIRGASLIVEDIDRADRMVKAGGRWFEFSEIG